MSITTAIDSSWPNSCPFQCIKVIIERMITVTQKIDTALVMKFLVTTIRIRKAKMIEAAIP